MEGTSQAVLGSSDQWKGLTSLSLFLKSEKIPALLYLRKGPEYLSCRGFRPIPTAYRPWAQISNHGRACTQGLLLYFHTNLVLVLGPRAGVVSGLFHLTSSLQNSKLKQQHTSSTLILLFSQPKKKLSFERAWHILIKEPTID